MSKSNKRSPDLMDKTRAAVAYLNADRCKDKSQEIYAFLSLFHPNMPEHKKKRLCK